MRNWLVKSEPGTYSWDDLERDKKTCWDGVRNYAARNFLGEMQKGDVAWFYHSGEEKSIVGKAEVIKTSYPDPKAEPGEKWLAVDLKPLKKAKTPLDLKTIKANAKLKGMELVRLSRLSVSPVTDGEAKEIESLIFSK